MYRSSLVPRLIPAIGLVGGVLMTSSVIGQILGINEKISVWSLTALLPIFLWELALGLWMIFKGFNRSAPILAQAAADEEHPSGSTRTISSPAVIATKAAGA
jgi:hypothetical protein